MRGKAILAAAVVLGLSAPIGARAASTQTVGCSTAGYTMQVPANWVVSGKCTSNPHIVSSDLQTVMQVQVVQHGFWNDSRARSSIKGDLIADAGKGGKVVIAPYLWTQTLHGKHFVSGSAAVMDAGGKKGVVVESQTFVRGLLYKFEAQIYYTTDKAALAARKSVVSAALKSVQVR